MHILKFIEEMDRAVGMEERKEAAIIRFQFRRRLSVGLKKDRDLRIFFHNDVKKHIRRLRDIRERRLFLSQRPHPWEIGEWQ